MDFRRRARAGEYVEECSHHWCVSGAAPDGGEQVSGGRGVSELANGYMPTFSPFAQPGKTGCQSDPEPRADQCRGRTPVCAAMYGAGREVIEGQRTASLTDPAD